MTSVEKIRAEFPLHWSIWNDDHKELQELFKTGQVSDDIFLAARFVFILYYRCD